MRTVSEVKTVKKTQAAKSTAIMQMLKTDINVLVKANTEKPR